MVHLHKENVFGIILHEQDHTGNAMWHLEPAGQNDQIWTDKKEKGQ